MDYLPWREPFAYEQDDQDTFVNHVDIDFLNDSLPSTSHNQLSDPGYRQPWREQDFLAVLEELDDHIGDLSVQNPMTESTSSSTSDPDSSPRWQQANTSQETTPFFKIQRPAHNPSSLKTSPSLAGAQALAAARSLAHQQSHPTTLHTSKAIITSNSPDDSLCEVSGDEDDSTVDHTHCKHRNLYQDRLDYRHRGRPVKPRKLSPKSWSPPRSRFDKPVVHMPVPIITKAIPFEKWAKEKDALWLRHEQEREAKEAAEAARQVKVLAKERQRRRKGEEAFDLWLSLKQRHEPTPAEGMTAKSQPDVAGERQARVKAARDAWLQAKAEQAQREAEQAQEHASFIVQEQKRKEAKGRRAYEHWLQEHPAQRSSNKPSTQPVRHPKPWIGPMDDMPTCQKKPSKSKRKAKHTRGGVRHEVPMVLSPPLLWAARLESERLRRVYR